WRSQLSGSPSWLRSVARAGRGPLASAGEASAMSAASAAAIEMVASFLIPAPVRSAPGPWPLPPAETTRRDGGHAARNPYRPNVQPGAQDRPGSGRGPLVVAVAAGGRGGGGGGERARRGRHRTVVAAVAGARGGGCAQGAGGGGAAVARARRPGATPAGARPAVARSRRARPRGQCVVRAGPAPRPRA